MNRESCILEGQLLFSNGYSMKTGPLERNGQATDIPIESQDGIKWVTFQVLKTEGPHSGLTEWEIFDQSCPDMHICKILVNGEFAYRWDMYSGEKAEVGLYTYPEDMPVVWKLNGVEMRLDVINQKIASGIQAATIQAVNAKTRDILDEVHLRRAAAFGKIKIKYWKSPCNRLRMWIDKQKIARKHHKLRALKRNSLG